MEVDVSSRNIESSLEAIFLDRCAVLWVVPWPTGAATVETYLVQFRTYIHKHLCRADVYLVFDRYYKDSIKGHIRQSRAQNASRTFNLQLNTQVTVQNVILNVTSNKAQLINLIIGDIIAHKDEIRDH